MDDRLEINFNEEAEEKDSSNRLIISSEDLLNVEVEPGTRVYPTISHEAYQNYTSHMGMNKKAGFARVAETNIFLYAISGLIGGMVAALIIQIFNPDNTNIQDITTAYLQSVLYTFLIGGLIGAALGAVDGFATRTLPKALAGAGIGFGVSGLTGGLSGILAEFLWNTIGEDHQVMAPNLILARGLVFAIIGIGIGAGQGASSRSVKRTLNGILGGLIGGAIGGLLFDIIGQVVGLAANSAFGQSTFLPGFAARVISIALMGLFVGLAIGLVEQVSKEAWIEIVSGMLLGKQFILYDANTVMGSSPKCSITLFKDITVSEQHSAIRNENGRFVIYSLSDRPTLVNGEAISRRQLHNRDVITVGTTSFQYSERAMVPKPQGY